MTTSFSAVQLTQIIMKNHHYQYRNFYYSCSLLTVFILLIQGPTFAITEQIQYESTDATNLRSMFPITTPISTVLYDNNNDDSFYDNENENSGGEIYDDGEDIHEHLASTTASQSGLITNITSHLNDEAQINEYDDEPSSYEDDNIYGNTMSVNRPGSKHPLSDSNEKKSVDVSSTSRIPFVSTNLWRDLFSKPAILVGITGGVVIGILSAILLVMFIIYRMRKKDEGSYALEEGPRKSPSHAYTRVSSREFFA